MVFAEEQYDRLAGGNDFVCFGNVNVVVNGQNVDVRFRGEVRRQREENLAFLRSVFCIPSVEGFPCYAFFFYSHAWRDDRDGIYGGCVHIGLNTFLSNVYNGPASLSFLHLCSIDLRLELL